MAVLEFSLTVGDRIALALRKADITQTELSNRLGVSQSTVSRWVNGGAIEVEDLVRIAVATGQRRLVLDLADLPDPDDTADQASSSSGWMNETAGHGWCEPTAA